ncbi:pogo transposable element with KRAB domain [Nephila pilipes]|uniref:Pogo transposable element with KRAB domain n=1 Tax=Nephila pilipes TaxID=299642 RepID=A0A8X6UKU2_NEPPI|nr:pogo transposable element with KRAB domain [Nephila pilipes]
MPSRRSYTAAEKLSIVKYAESHKNREASHHFLVNEADARLKRKSKKTTNHVWEEKEKRVVPSRRTTLVQHLPDDHEDKLPRFQKIVLKLRKENMYELSLVGNADQTLLTFDMLFNNTVVVKGVYIRVHEKGCMDEALTTDWLKSAWGRRPRKPPSILVLYSFRYRRMPSIQKEMREIKSDLVNIRGCMTRLFQFLDVSVNKPMEEITRRKWNAGLSDGNHTYTTGGRQPTLLNVAK